MDFTEQTKEEVKRKAAFRCCRCQNIGVHVHHIIPQEEGGSADIDNAAPLCPNCHNYYGANPDKRKEIRQMRDWWYERAEMIYPDNRQLSRLEDIDSKLDKVLQNQTSLDEYKEALFTYTHELFHLTNEMINSMTLETVVTSGSGIVNASYSPSSSPSPSPSAEPTESELSDNVTVVNFPEEPK